LQETPTNFVVLFQFSSIVLFKVIKNKQEQFLNFKKNTANVYPFKKIVPLEDIAWKIFLTRRLEKMQNLKKIDILMF